MQVHQAVLTSGSPGYPSIFFIDVGQGPPICKVPREGVCHKVERRIMVQLPRRRSNGIWNYPSLAEEIKGSGLKDMEVYIGRKQNMVAKYISTRTILYLCLEEDILPEAREAMR